MNRLMKSLSALGVSATLVTPNINAQALSNSNPELRGTKDLKIEQGTTYNPLNGVHAYDKEDGDLTDAIQVKGHVDTTKPGVYKVEYIVKDSDGAIDSSINYVEVINHDNH